MKPKTPNTSRKHEKTYTENIIFLATPRQREFLILFARKKGVSVSKILRYCIGRLMAKNPELAEIAEARVKE